MSSTEQNTSIGKVLSSELTSIIVRSEDLKEIEKIKDNLNIGNLLKIENGNFDHVVAIIQGVKISDTTDDDNYKLDIICQPIGAMTDEGVFERGIKRIPLPNENAFLIDKEMLKKIFEENHDFDFQAGYLAQNEEIKAMINGDKLFSKHVAIVGSTGSGKSCVVSKLLQSAVEIENEKNKNLNNQKNSHIIIFDIHSEYEAAFKLNDSEKFNINTLSVENLKLPYWLMNSEELEDLFIEGNDQNNYNQASQFKSAVIKNKIQKNNNQNVNYDTPVEFDIFEIRNYLENLNRERVDKIDKKTPMLSDLTRIKDRFEKYFENILEFDQTKTNNGPYNGDFARFVTRLETRLSDERLKFLLSPKKEDGTPYKSKDFEEIMKQFTGYIDKSNITIIDLSGIPFEVLSITVSLISRLIFDFCFHYSKIKHQDNNLNDIPMMIVCEEAHNYIPKSNEAQYKASKKSIERIAKEGRKYGLSLMVVSQRPSEVSETIMAQCNNFVALRLTNSSDQNYIKSLLPDCIGNICDSLPTLQPGEALIVGDATLMPMITQFNLPNPMPKSKTVAFLKEWRSDWKDVLFKNIIDRWRN